MRPGAATSLALALLVGGRVFAAMKRSLGVGEWVRRGLGAAVLAAVAVIGLGLDTGFLTRVSAAGTASLEQGLLDRLHPGADRPMAMTGGHQGALPVEDEMPPLTGAVAWLNSPPLTTEGLRGKVVLVDFWTYSCINCLRSIPYVRAWAEKYKDQGLVVIGVHAPEFAFEQKIDNVKKAVADLGIGYPVAIDNDYAIWRAFGNQYWPAHYFIDAQGRIRHHHFGEGEYDESERVIQQLLAEAGKSSVSDRLVAVQANRARKPPPIWPMRNRRKPISGSPGRRISSPPAVPSATRRMSIRRGRHASTSGAYPATGRSAESMRNSTSRKAESSTASMRATCTLCSARRRRQRPSGSASPSTARRRGTAMAPIPMPMARAS